MLVYIFTDIAITPRDLESHLHSAVDESFNCITIDGDTSTNDTVLLSASGASGVEYTTARAEAFSRALTEVSRSLAHQIVDDGEGVTHVVTLDVRGAPTTADARKVAKSIAHSPLCKTAWSSADPNWGRILAAAGYSGIAIEPDRTSISIGPHKVFDHGTRGQFDEAATHQTMLAREFTIAIDLGLGDAACRVVTCDLTVEYVNINADYST